MATVQYIGDTPITTLDDFPYDWYKDDGAFEDGHCIRYRKLEVIKSNKIVSQVPIMRVPYDPGMTGGAYTVEETLGWKTSHSQTKTTAMELGLKALTAGGNEVASASYSNEISRTQTVGKTQTARYSLVYNIKPKHVLEVFKDQWKIKARMHITQWIRHAADAFGLIGLRNPWVGRGESSYEMTYTIDCAPNVITIPIADKAGFEVMNEGYHSNAFKFHWVRFAKNLFVNNSSSEQTGRDNLRELPNGTIEAIVMHYYDGSKPKRKWEDFSGEIVALSAASAAP